MSIYLNDALQNRDVKMYAENYIKDEISTLQVQKDTKTSEAIQVSSEQKKALQKEVIKDRGFEFGY